MSKIAVVGQGNMGLVHARSWAHLGLEDEIGYVLARSPRRWFDPAPHARLVTAIDEIVRDPDVDIVSICTPTPSHAELAIAALRAGKHVLLEKPIALTVPDAEAIASAAEESGTTLMIAQVVRFFAGYRELRDLWQEGRIGRVSSVRATRLSPIPADTPWLTDDAQSGGVVVDFAIHDYDQVNLFLGTPIAVTAVQTAPDGPIETTIEYEGGGIGQVLSSMALPAGTPFSSSIELLGSKGWAAYHFVAGSDDDEYLGSDGSSGRSTISIATSGTHTSYSVVDPHPYTRQAAYFLRCAREGIRPDECPTWSAIDALTVALAARTSLKTGRRVACDTTLRKAHQ